MLDGHDVLDVFGARTLVTGRLPPCLVERPRTPPSKQRSWQAALARHGRDSARASPAAPYPRVVVGSDPASWHRGAFGTAVLRACPPLELSPLPSSSPTRQVMERCWKVRRRRATHQRLLPTMAQLTQTLRHSLCDYQTLKQRVLSVMQSVRKRSKSSAA